MHGILWLASYPKSGNTWIRAFLANYLRNPKVPIPINELPGFIAGDGLAAPFEKVAGHSVADMDVAEIQRLRLKVHEILARSGSGTVMVKTHNAISYLNDIPTINPEVTAGAIYIVRNPLDLAVSYAHHMDISLDRAVAAISSDETRITTHGNQVYQYLGSWGSHVRSWVTAPGLRLHLMRYEDMAQKPRPTYRGLVSFLGLPMNTARLKKAIRFSDFKVMSGQETRSGFVEAAPGGSRRFFRQGKVGGWRDKLSPEQARELVDAHRGVMAEFGYLTKEGEPVF